MRQSLSLGDFAWARCDGRFLALIIERRTIQDLVGRSASADHIEQVRFLLIPFGFRRVPSDSP